jgi:hypothetical protein
MDDVFSDPKIPISEHSPDVEALGLTRVMSAQRLQVVAPADSLT